MRALSSAMVLMAAVALAGPAVGGVPRPTGSRARDGGFDSGRGFGHTVEFYRRWLRKQGIDAREEGPYQVAGVTVSRFLLRRPHADFLAIHVFAQGGRTRIRIVLPTAAVP